MLILGIESTCDETACAVVKDGEVILSNIIFSQSEHRKFGGVVPEIASREHVSKISIITRRALEEANVEMESIDKIAVSYGPGLSGSISAGLAFAEGLAFSHNKPLVYVNHIKAHLYAACMGKEVVFPCLGVILSGAHSCLVLMKSFRDYVMLGEVVDDAVGEAFDKVAKMLELGYPGGVEVEKNASQAVSSIPLTRCKAREGKYYFSNSGLKTQVMYLVKDAKKNNKFNDEFVKTICKSFQDVVIKDIRKKVEMAIDEFGVSSVVFGGGVVNNNALRVELSKHCKAKLLFPDKNLSIDNGAMIAGFAFVGGEKEVKDIETRIPW